MNQALPQLIHFGREICNDLQQAERREWLIANGLGGYAAGTLAGTLTRRYHGLLVAPLKPPLGRTLVFAKADATLFVDEMHYPLYSNRWRDDVIEPRGYLHLEAFHLDGRQPVWRYAIGDIRLEARIWMESGANTTYLAWRLLNQPMACDQVRLSVRLLINARDHHAQTQRAEFDPGIEQSEHELRVTLPQGPTLAFRSQYGNFTTDNSWVENFALSEEKSRGLPDTDNHLCAGEIELPIHSGEWTGFAASLEADCSPSPGEALRQRQQHDASLLRQAKVQASELSDAPAWIDQLVLAADSFLIERPMPDGHNGVSVIAGYPWFGDWGRDTFIALPGLTLTTHRQEHARRLLRSWSAWLDEGLLPNHFPEQGTRPAYNSADASLWLIEAWRAYVEATRDIPGIRRHYPQLKEIMDRYRSGTGDAIHVDPADGLLCVGGRDSPLTWMDARVEGRPPVTPRNGKPVELNALWYNALMSMAEFAKLIGEQPQPYMNEAHQLRSGFKRFIRADGAGLLDVLDGAQDEGARIRPNQILAVSLRHSPLEPGLQSSVVKVVGKRLHSSYGLRTLDPDDPAYRAIYEGDLSSRDNSYHQGPAWAWLLPHYALAVHRVTGDAVYAQSLLDPLADHLSDGGLGTISELFDGEPPHTPRGAPSQAWSVACTLMAWCRLERVKRSY